MRCRKEENLSKEAGLCYWDYYNEGTEFYKNYLLLHKRLGNPLIFAGGAWTWNGVAPCVSRALKISYDALDACVETGTEDVFVTAWMDNGAETPLLTVLPTLLLYGEYGFGERPDRKKLEERFAFCFGKGWNNIVCWMLLIILIIRSGAGNVWGLLLVMTWIGKDMITDTA